MPLFFDTEGRVIPPGRYSTLRKLQPLDASTPPWLTLGTAGVDAGASLTYVSPSNTATFLPPGIRTATAAIAGRCATFYGEPINAQLESLRAVRMRLLTTGAANAGRNMYLGLVDTVGAATKGLEVKAVGDVAHLRGFDAGGVTDLPTYFNWELNGNVIFDVSLWFLPQERLAYLGAGETFDVIKDFTGDVDLGVLTPFIRTETLASSSRATAIHGFEIETFYL